MARGILTFTNADTPIAADSVPAEDETDEQDAGAAAAPPAGGAGAAH